MYRRQSAENQAVETFVRRFEQPAQMRVAIAAQGDAPGKTSEPAPGRHAITYVCATARVTKTADMEHIAVRIGESMLLSTVHADAIILACNEVATSRAKEPPLVFGDALDLSVG